MILIHLLCAGRPDIGDLQYLFSKGKPLFWGEAGSSLFPVGVIHAITVFTARLVFSGFPGGSGSKESACSAGDLSSIPGLGRSPGGGHDNPLQYSFLENPVDRGAW